MFITAFGVLCVFTVFLSGPAGEPAFAFSRGRSALTFQKVELSGRSLAVPAIAVLLRGFCCILEGLWTILFALCCLTTGAGCHREADAEGVLVCLLNYVLFVAHPCFNGSRQWFCIMTIAKGFHVTAFRLMVLVFLGWLICCYV